MGGYSYVGIYYPNHQYCDTSIPWVNLDISVTDSPRAYDLELAVVNKYRRFLFNICENLYMPSNQKMDIELFKYIIVSSIPQNFLSTIATNPRLRVINNYTEFGSFLNTYGVRYV